MVYVGHRLNNTTLDPIRHLIVGFPIDFMTLNCTIAVAGKLQLIDKLHDPFTKTSGHLP